MVNEWHEDVKKWWWRICVWIGDSTWMVQVSNSRAKKNHKNQKIPGELKAMEVK